jgi:hypothetical protein
MNKTLIPRYVKSLSCSKQCAGKPRHQRTDKYQLFLSQTEVRNTECSCNALRTHSTTDICKLVQQISITQDILKSSSTEDTFKKLSCLMSPSCHCRWHANCLTALTVSIATRRTEHIRPQHCTCHMLNTSSNLCTEQDT